ncbi:lamin tail domain-containing protein [Hymenobacter negativus]|uniref:Lamin tail domain-containing protein n=1 Tax=Hymenobacter negativus TaxID=2795026 RepID=A0ABS3QCM7_9BACT|nr:lamin tail domain-containing protein [Hymenobacter negativus]MBO2008989.1 lamin tail domain-containing protein [Hymenobacter negativus]
MKKLFTKMCSQYRSYYSGLLLVASGLMPVLAQAQSSTVVISEVYAGGGSAGATYQNDFVELYNKTNVSLPLNGYSVQYNPASGGGAYAMVALGNVSIPANGHLLVQLGAGANGGPLPTPDVTGSLALAVGGGRIALVSNTTALQDADPANAPGVVDFLGYGSSAATYEGSGPALGMAGLVSLERKARATSTSASLAAGGDDVDQGNGYDSNDNASDFVARTPEPQNAGAAAEVFTPSVTYYNTKNATGSLSELSTFSSTPDGSGPSPASFTRAFQVFNVGGSGLSLSGNWTVTGAGSKVVLLANATLTVPANYNLNALLDMSSGATLVEYNAAPGVTYGNLDATSIIEFAQSGDYTIPVLPSPGYGNLTLRDASKHLDAGTTIVRGTLLVKNVGGNSNVFGGAPNAASTLALGGNLKLTGTVSFSSSATDRIVLTATNTTASQVIDGGGNVIKLYSLILPTGQAGVSLSGSGSSLELGNTSGGGYQLGAGTLLTLNANTLAFAAGGKATVAGTGALAVDATSSIVIDKNNTTGFGGTTGSATLYLAPGSTQINNLTVNSAGNSTVLAGTLVLSGTLTVNGALTLNGSTLGLTGGQTLTMNGLMDIQNGFFSASDASIVVGGAGNMGFMYFRGGAGNQMRNFTMARPNQTLYLNSPIALSSSLNITDGVLGVINTITMSGTVNTTGNGRMQSSTTANLLINGTGPLGTIIFTDAGGFLNTLALNRPGGTLNIEGLSLNVRYPSLSAGVLHIGANMALNITGPLVVDDPAVAKFAATPTSSISFTSFNNQTPVDIGPLAFVPGQDLISSLTMARSAGTVANPLDPPLAQLTSNLTVRTLVLTRGSFFVQGNNRLSVLPGGGLVGGSANSYTNTLTLASVTNANPVFATLGFPLGVNGEYRPLTFNVTDAVTGTTSYTARQIEGRATSRTLPNTLLRVSGLRYYNVVAEAGGSSVLQSATIRLSYDLTADQVTAGNASLLRIAMVDPADNTKWKNMGGSGSGANITSNMILPGPFGDFILATDGNTPQNVNPLPVELSAFSAQRLPSKAVSVRWTTASEKNSDHFDVQRSLNARDFVTIATAKAQGSSTSAIAYAALDQTAPAAQLYYRLRQVDLDGTVAYSPVLTVSGLDTPLELALYPNPATDRLTAAAPALAERTFRVLNTLGQVLATGRADAENPTVDVRDLPTGTYLLELSSPDGRQVRRFVKTN